MKTMQAAAREIAPYLLATDVAHGEAQSESLDTKHKGFLQISARLHKLATTLPSSVAVVTRLTANKRQKQTASKH
jgi:hypothetical protein